MEEEWKEGVEAEEEAGKKNEGRLLKLLTVRRGSIRPPAAYIILV
jgi:hypothetical protein